MNLVWAALLSVLVTPAWAAESWSDVERLANDQYSAIVQTHPWVGVSLGLIRNGEAEFYSFGGVGPHTVFTANSITKTFVGTMLAQDVIENQVKLTEPVQSLLPHEKIPSAPDRQIELVDLATYSSGLATVPSNLIQPATLDTYRGYTDALFFSYLAGLQFSDGDIGTHYLYSNTGFGLLGYALSQEEGATFAQAVESHVLRPMGLNETTADLSVASLMPSVAVGHDHLGVVQPPRSGPETMAGSWSIQSTASDLIRYLEYYLSSPDPALDLAQTSTGRPAGDGFSSGLGWFVHDSSGTRFKDGGGGGFTSIVFFNRARGIALVMLSNTEDAPDIQVEQRAWNLMTALMSENSTK